MQTNGLQFVLAHVADLATARAFYTEKLGLTVAAEQPGFVQFAQPGGKGAWFALSESADARPFSDPEFWWYVDDADSACADLTSVASRSPSSRMICRSGAPSPSTTPPAIRSTCWSCARSFPIGNGSVP